MALRHILLWMTSSNRQSFIATNSGFISTAFGESHRNSSSFTVMAPPSCSRELVCQVTSALIIGLNSDACWDAYIWVKDADALYEELRSGGVKITRQIEDAPYGCRDFDVEDNSGYILCFGQDLET